MRRMVWLVLIAALALPAGIAHGAAEKRQQIPLDGSPSLGPADAPVTICEFIDFQ